MTILVKTANQQWTKGEQKTFIREQDLQTLLLNSPELIEVADHSTVLLTDEAFMSNGTFADLLGVTSTGRILIIETKLASNPEIRRKIIGQVFEYGSRLWQTEYDQFDQYFRKHINKPLIEHFQTLVDDFDGTTFRQMVEATLKAGSFELLIAVDDMNEDLERILVYMGSCGRGPRLEALAFRLYEQQGTQILVPQRYGGGQDLQTSSKPTPEHFVERSLNEDMRQKMTLILSAWTGTGCIVKTNKVGLSLQVGLPHRIVTMFYATPDDTYGLQPSFKSMESGGMPAEMVAELRNRLSKVPGLIPDKMLKSSEPTTRFGTVPLESVQQFVQIMREAAERWRASL